MNEQQPATPTPDVTPAPAVPAPIVTLHQAQRALAGILRGSGLPAMIPAVPRKIDHLLRGGR